MKFFLKLAFIFLGLSACSFQKDKTDPTIDTTTPVISASQASYSLASQYIFGKSCVGCHNSTDMQGGINLQAYPNVAALIEKIKVQIESGKMPKAPAAPLSQRQKDLFEVWYAAGYPQNLAGQPNSPVVPVEANFPSILERVFDVKCATCHNPKGHAPGIPLKTVEQLVCTPPPLVIAGKIGAGDLIKVINPASPSMPPKKANIPAVTPQEFEAIQEWIKNGALAGVGENSFAVNCPPLPPLPDPVPLEAKFASIKRDIFEMKCTVCHSAKGRMPDLPLERPEDLLGGEKPLVVPGDMKSKLLAVFAPKARHPMPPPDNGIDPLTAEELGAIQEWIRAGARD
ncbi:MAG: hypothetical protein ACXWQO_06395 [Bdellovibrionota bacterium]